MHGNNPATEAETAVTMVPVTGEGVAAAIEPYPSVNPYSNLTEVLELLAFTVPFKVAPEGVSDEAAAVVTAGGSARVVKVRMGVPDAVPAALVAETR